MRKQIVVFGAALTLLVGCSKGPASRSQANAGRKDSQQLGSATDIMDSRTGKADRNEADRADDGLGGPAQRQSGNYKSVQQSAQMPDRELEKTVKVALTTGSTGTSGVIADNQLTQIEVKADNGVVTLAGPVKNEEDKRIIEKQVKGMKGVRSVINNLQVGSEKVSTEAPLVPRSPGNEPK
jgi:osmotically-inducible protein OsmY